MAFIEEEVTLRAITAVEKTKMNQLIADFEAQVNPGNERLFSSITGLLPFVESKSFPLYMKYLKASLTPENNDKDDDDGDSTTDYGDFTRIHIVTFLESVMPDNASRRKTLGWISKHWEEIILPGAQFCRIRLLGAIFLKSSFEPLKTKSTPQISLLPPEYSNALLLFEALLSCEADRLIERFQERQMGHTGLRWPIYWNKCSLRCACMMVRHLMIPKKHRRGDPGSVAALEKWEAMSFREAGWELRGWELMNEIYGEVWDDGLGKNAYDVTKHVIERIMGPRKRMKYVQYIWSQTRYETSAATTVFRKKQLLFFHALTHPSIPLTLARLNGDRYMLLGFSEDTEVLVDGKMEPHCFWSCSRRPFMDGEKVKLEVIQVDEGTRLAVHSLAPPPPAIFFAYQKIGRPIW